MNRRSFLRNIAHSAGLVALSACTLRIENPLLRIEEGREYPHGTASWDALRDYCVKDVELTEKLANYNYGHHNWRPAYGVAGEVKSLGEHVERGYFEMDLSAAEARCYSYYQAAKAEALTGKRQDFPLTGKRQKNFKEV